MCSCRGGLLVETDVFCNQLSVPLPNSLTNDGDFIIARQRPMGFSDAADRSDTERLLSPQAPPEDTPPGVKSFISARVNQSTHQPSALRPRGGRGPSILLIASATILCPQPLPAFVATCATILHPSYYLSLSRAMKPARED